jgi:hypothetical protein
VLTSGPTPPWLRLFIIQYFGILLKGLSGHLISVAAGCHRLLLSLLQDLGTKVQDFFPGDSNLPSIAKLNFAGDVAKWQTQLTKCAALLSSGLLIMNSPGPSHHAVIRASIAGKSAC